MQPKSKLQLLFIALPIILIICYQWGIKRTLEQREEYIALQHKAEEVKDIPQQTVLLRQRSAYLDSVMQQVNLGNTSFENNLIRFLSSATDSLKVSISDFNPTHKATQNEIMINTFNLTLSGPFTGILKSVYGLETRGNFGEITHIRFYKERNYRSRSNTLKADILLQQVQ